MITYLCCSNENGNQQTLKSFRDPRVFANVLRSLQVLHKFWQIWNETFLIPYTKLAAVIVAVAGTYGMIRLDLSRSRAMAGSAAFCLLYLYTLYHRYGILNELSEETLRKWKTSSKTPKHVKKTFDSIPEFKIWVGNYYYVSKTTVLSIMETVIDNTITLLMM